MNKQIFTILCFAASTLLVNAASPELISEWDFTSGEINSKDGSFKAQMRGTTIIDNDEKSGKFLKIGMQPQNKAEGIVMLKEYPELSPRGAFKLEAEIRMRDRSGSQTALFIWDNKYGMHTTNLVRGFSFYLQRKGDKGNYFLPEVWLGMGQSQLCFAGTLIELATDKKYTVAFEYDGRDKVDFYLDGKLLRSVKGTYFNIVDAKGEINKGVPQTGDIAPANFPAAIGDRYNETFSHFDGDIFKVRLWKIPTDDSRKTQ